MVIGFLKEHVSFEYHLKLTEFAVYGQMQFYVFVRGHVAQYTYTQFIQFIKMYICSISNLFLSLQGAYSFGNKYSGLTIKNLLVRSKVEVKQTESQKAPKQAGQKNPFHKK